VFSIQFLAFGQEFHNIISFGFGQEFSFWCIPTASDSYLCKAKKTTSYHHIFDEHTQNHKLKLIFVNAFVFYTPKTSAVFTI